MTNQSGEISSIQTINSKIYNFSKKWNIVSMLAHDMNETLVNTGLIKIVCSSKIGINE